MVDKQDLLKKMVDKALFGRENGRYSEKSTKRAADEQQARFEF
jgi:hypothetical protein